MSGVQSAVPGVAAGAAKARMTARWKQRKLACFSPAAERLRTARSGRCIELVFCTLTDTLVTARETGVSIVLTVLWGDGWLAAHRARIVLVLASQTPLPFAGNVTRAARREPVATQKFQSRNVEL